MIENNTNLIQYNITIILIRTIMKLSYQKPRVKLVDEDGNAFSILAKVKLAMSKAGATKEEIDRYMKEAMFGDYNNLIDVTADYVEVE